ncbi:MAG: 4-hydroxy-tetrahydrodipicolinate reductase [Alphaproteobacteria bacterium]
MAVDLKIAVMGAGGRMGRMVVKTVSESDGAAVSGATEAEGSDLIGRDAGALAGVGALGVALVADPVPVIAAADAVIDFTAAAATVRHAELAAQAQTVYVAGTTGLDADQEAALVRAARHTALVYAPNMSVAVTLLFALTEQVAGVLGAADYDIEILEMHHRHKVDAPSGTALGLGRAAAAGRGVALDEVAVMSREGQTGARAEGAIGFATLRGGDVAGEHSVIYAAEGERLELVHRATNRQIFARGAVRAAIWAQGREPALYSMRDVLGV